MEKCNQLMRGGGENCREHDAPRLPKDLSMAAQATTMATAQKSHAMRIALGKARVDFGFPPQITVNARGEGRSD